MKKKCLAFGIILLLMATGFSSVIANTEKVNSKETVNSQFSKQILTRKDIPLLSNTIALSKDTETREILTEILNKVSISGSITEQEIEELVEGFRWRPFIGPFVVGYLYPYQLWFIPGQRIFNLFSFYVGPFIVGTWEQGMFHENSNGIVFLGVGLIFQTQVDPGARIYTHFNGVCTVGFYKPI